MWVFACLSFICFVLKKYSIKNATTDGLKEKINKIIVIWTYLVSSIWAPSWSGKWDLVRYSKHLCGLHPEKRRGCSENLKTVHQFSIWFTASLRKERLGAPHRLLPAAERPGQAPRGERPTAQWPTTGPWLQDVLGCELDSSVPPKNRSPGGAYFEFWSHIWHIFCSPKFCEIIHHFQYEVHEVNQSAMRCQESPGLLSADLFGPTAILGISRSLLYFLAIFGVNWKTSDQGTSSSKISTLGVKNVI